MTYLKSAITTVIALILFLSAYTYFSFDEKYNIEQALDSYLKGEYSEAREILEGVDREDVNARKLLYLAYVERDSGHLKASDKYLNEAAKLTRHDTRSKLRLEIYSNQALNGYLQGNFSEMEKALVQARKYLGNTENEWIEFFELLYLNSANPEEMKNIREEDSQYWEKVKENIPYSQWMKRSFNSRFTPFWQISNHITYLINMGKYVQARQLIEEQILKSNQQEKDDLYLLMARSYAKEAKDKPPLAATPYYKLAFNYYDKVPFHHDKFKTERKEFFENSKKQVEVLIDNNKFDEIDFFVNVLDKFDDEQETQKLSDTFIALVDKQKEEKKWNNVYQLLGLLNRILPDNATRNQLNERLQNELVEAIEMGDANKVKNSWNFVFLLNTNDEDLKTKYMQHIQDKTVALLTDDSAMRPQGFELIKLWNGLETDPQRREAFSEILVKNTSDLWKKPSDGEDAVRLLLVALQIVSSQGGENIQDLIKEELKNNYKALLDSENYDSLPSIVRASQLVNVGDFTLINQENFQDYIKEAQYLFSERQFKKANELTNWILTLKPNHKKALTIAGLVNYYEGHYKIAEGYLNKIQSDNPEIRIALAVSQILSGVNTDEGKESIHEMEKQNLVGKNIYLRLGFGEVVNQNPESAQYWLGKLNKKNDEVKIGSALAAAELGRWNEVLNYLSGLSPDYQHLDAVMSLQLIAQINLDDEKGAEKAFDRLMSNSPSPVKGSYSQPFTILSSRMLNDYSRKYTASLYFEELGNVEEALRYLKEIKDPSPTVLMREGDLLIGLEEYHDAKIQLIKALNLAKGLPETENLQADILIKLAYASSQQEQKIDSYVFYKEYYALKPNSDEYRAEYANSLVNVRRYELADEQYALIKEGGLYKSAYNLQLIETFVHLNRFPQADQLAEEWVLSSEKIDQETLLKLAQLMLITENEALIDRILSQLVPIHELNAVELVELIKLYMYQGNFVFASGLLKEKEALLEQSSEGLFGIAEFYQFYSDRKMALDYAKRALEKDPYNQNIQQFIQSNRSDISLSSLVEKLKVEDNEANGGPINYDKKLMLIQSIITKSIEKVLANPDLTFHTIFELRTVLVSLIKLSEKLSDVPKVNLFLGQLYYLLDNIQEAEEYYSKAVDLDLSYSLAHQYLGLLYLRNNELNLSKVELLEAIRYKPYNADAWFLLGKVNEEKGAFYDSIMAYNHSIRFKPNNPRPYLLMGKLQLEVNNPEGAISTLEKSLIISPNDIEALKLLLLALYNPHLYFEGGSESDIIAQRTKVEGKLQDLAPEDLEKILAEIKSEDEFKPIKKMSFPY